MSDSDPILTRSQRQLGVLQTRPKATLHVGGGLRVDGSFTVVQGPVSLPQNSTQQLLGTYSTALAWSVPQASVWAETPVQVTATWTGVRLRIEFNVPLACLIKGQRVYWALAVDGVMPTQSLGALDAPEASYGMMANGVHYVLPVTAGFHRIALALYGPAGTQILNGVLSTFYVTEQKS